MAHPKIKQTRTFTDDFAEPLQLSSDQIISIDEQTYKFFKEYTFSADPDYNESKARYRYYIAIARILNDSQKTILKQIIKKQKEKHVSRDFETIKSERLLKKYESLNLSQDRYQQFRTKLQDINSLTRKMFNESMKNYLLRKPHRKRFLEAADLILKDFLTRNEFEIFNKIEEDDHRRMRDTRASAIQHSYSTLDLKKKQAKQIFDYEENESVIDKNNEYYSELEKLDLFKQFMQSILNKEQFATYTTHYNDRKNTLKDGIIERNLLKKQEVIRLQNRKEFLVTEYLPTLCKWRSEIESFLDKDLKKNISVLRTDYHKRIVGLFNRHKKETLRHYKNLFPNYILQLELELELRALIPDAIFLEETGDMISKISPELRKRILDSNETVKKINYRLNQFEADNYENTGGTYGGWITVIRNPRDEKSDNVSILSTLLLHPEISNNIAFMNTILDT